MVSTWSPSRAASARSWVTWTMGRENRSRTRASTRRSATRLAASKAEKGSSNSKALGLRAKAWHKHRVGASPPDMVEGLASASREMPKSSSNSAATHYPRWHRPRLSQGHVRKKRIFLEDQSDIALARRQAHAGRRVPPDRVPPGRPGPHPALRARPACVAPWSCPSRTGRSGRESVRPDRRSPRPG